MVEISAVEQNKNINIFTYSRMANYGKFYKKTHKKFKQFLFAFYIIRRGGNIPITRNINK